MRRLLQIAILPITLALAACGNDSNTAKDETLASEHPLRMCADVASVDEAQQLLTAGVVIAAHQVEDGVSAYELLVNQLLGMILNGIDLFQLDGYETEFDGSAYTLRTGDSSLTFRLVYAVDFAGHSAGDPIEADFFSLSSYIRDVDIDIGGSITSPRIDYDFEAGPLLELIDGDISFSGRSLSGIEANVRFRSDVIGVELDSIRQKHFTAPVLSTLGAVTAEFDYRIHIRTLPVAVLEILDLIEEDGLRVSYADSYVDTTLRVLGEQYLRTRVTFDDATFLLREDDDGGWWEGDYSGTHDVQLTRRGPDRRERFYEHGYLSTREANFTDYHCDAAHTALWGTAHHAEDLQGGRFVLKQGGEFEYGLGPIPDGGRDSK